MGDHHKPDRKKAQTDTNLYPHSRAEENNENFPLDNVKYKVNVKQTHHAVSEFALHHHFFRRDSSRDSFQHPHRNLGMPHLPRPAR